MPFKNFKVQVLMHVDEVRTSLLITDFTVKEVTD